MSRATTSLPTPVSPRISTLAFVRAAVAISVRSALIAGLSPTSASSSPLNGTSGQRTPPFLHSWFRKPSSRDSWAKPTDRGFGPHARCSCTEPSRWNRPSRNTPPSTRRSIGSGVSATIRMSPTNGSRTQPIEERDLLGQLQRRDVIKEQRPGPVDGQVQGAGDDTSADGAGGETGDCRAHGLEPAARTVDEQVLVGPL